MIFQHAASFTKKKEREEAEEREGEKKEPEKNVLKRPIEFVCFPPAICVLEITHYSKDKKIMFQFCGLRTEKHPLLFFLADFLRFHPHPRALRPI